MRGAARQAQRERDLRLNTFRGTQGIFLPLGDALCSMLFGGPTTVPPDPPPPPTPGVWTGSLSPGAYAYWPNLGEGISSKGGAIAAKVTAPPNTTFRFLLISIDLYQVVASGTGTGSARELRFTGPAGRYAWYVEAERGAGAFRIEATIP